jgi:F-type H+-transporting ATPase subunit gamma
MANLKELKDRIASVTATQKITKAMQMVAAAKLRRAQETALAARPYSQRMNQVLSNVAGVLVGNDGAPKLLTGTGKNETHLLIVATSERGLCGGFNSSIVKIAREKAVSLMAEGKTVKILCVGKKGHDAMKRQFAQQIIELIEIRVKNVSFNNAQSVGTKVLDMFEAGEFDVCTLFYAEFKSVIEQTPTALQLIPAQIEADEDAHTSGGNGPGACYEYEPDESEILEVLLPRNVNVQIFRALLENAASEQGARMSAMDNATRNAGDMIDKLTLTYNRSRQAKITTELIEIISGAEAL